MIRLLRHDKNNFSSTRWRPYWRIQGKVRWYFAMDSWCMGKLLGKRGRREEIFQYCLVPFSPDKFLYFRAIQGHSGRTLADILHCKTMYCYRMTLQSTSTTSETLSKCTPLSKVDWSKKEKASEGTCNQSSSQPWTRCTLGKIWQKFNTICTNTNTLGELITIQFFWCNLTPAQRKEVAILSNSITCNYSFKHITSDLKRKSGMHENWWRTLLQSVSVTQATSRNTRAELATRSEGCTYQGFEKIRRSRERSS